MKSPVTSAVSLFLVFFSLYLLTASPGRLFSGDGGMTLAMAARTYDQGFGPMPLRVGATKPTCRCPKRVYNCSYVLTLTVALLSGDR